MFLNSFLFLVFIDFSFCKMCFSEIFVFFLVDEMIILMCFLVMMMFFFFMELFLLLVVVVSVVFGNFKEYSSKSEDVKKLDFLEVMLRFMFFLVV